MKKISRRNFLRASAAGVCAVSLGGMMSACSSSADNGETTAVIETETGTETETSVGQEEGKFVLNMKQDENAISDPVFYTLSSSEIEDFNMLHSENSSDQYVLCNLISSLCASDSAGKMIPAVAKSWEANEDYTEWTFHLRDDATWVDINGIYQADVVAADWVAGMEWCMNAHKNQSAHTSQFIEMVRGAEEYYDLTASMDEEEAQALTWDNETFLSMVGISAPDDTTLTYEMSGSKPYFYTLATWAGMFPAPVEQLETMTADEYLGQTYETMWYCGPYILTEFINGSEKVYEPNESWFGNSEHTRFASITDKIIDSNDTAFTIYQSGDIDYVTLTESALATITEGTQYYDYLTEGLRAKYSYQCHWCYNKNKEDGTPDVNWNTAIANEAFRLSIYYGLDLTNYYRRVNTINPLKCENNCHTMVGLTYTSDGTDYTELVKEKLGVKAYDGESMCRYNKELGEKYKAQAIEELTALGVSFPVEFDYYIAGNSSTAVDNANVMADCYKTCLGSDYVQLNIKTYVSSLSNEVRIPRLGSFYLSGWGADFSDPVNFLGQETLGSDSAYYSNDYSHINDFVGDDAETPYSEELIETYQEFTDMVEKADAIIDDMDVRYDAFAEAEAYMISHGLVLPFYYSQGWQLTKINDYTKANALCGQVGNYYYVDLDTNVNGYTTAEYEEFARAAGAL